MHNDNNIKHSGKCKKKHFRPILRLMVCMTLNCVGLMCFFIYLNVCYYG